MGHEMVTPPAWCADGMNTYLVSAAYEQSGHGLDGPVSLWPLIDDLSGGWAACEGKLEEATTIMSHNSNSESDTTVYEPGDPDTSFSFLEADKQPYPQEHQPAPDIYHYNGIDDTVHQFSVGPDGRPLPPEFQPPELTVLYQGQLLLMREQCPHSTAVPEVSIKWTKFVSNCRLHQSDLFA
jgi:hypothetical protein